MKKLILIQLLYIFCIVAQNLSANPNSLSLFVDDYSMGNVCAVDLDGVHCFSIWNAWRGHRGGRRTDWKTFYVPSAIAVTVQQNSILTHSPDGLRESSMQYPDQSHGRIAALPLTNVKQIAVGLRQLYFRAKDGSDYYNNSYCAIDRTEMKCWYYDFKNKEGAVHQSVLKPIPVPSFKNVKQINGEFTKDKNGIISEFCAIDNSDVKCFSENPNLSKNQPSLKNPVQVAFSYDTACAIDLNGLHCWNNSSSDIFQPKLVRPRIVSLSKYGEKNRIVCALDDEGAHCWNRKDGQKEYVKYKLPDLKRPRSIVSHYSGACALDDTGLVCWTFGYWDTPKSNFELTQRVIRIADPSLTRPWNQFDFNQLEPAFDEVIKKSTAVRAQYFSNLALLIKTSLENKTLEDIHPTSKYLAIKLVSPAILSIDSKYGIQNMIPKFKESIQIFENELGINATSKVPHDAFNRRLAMHSILAAMNTLKAFLSGDERIALMNLTRTLALSAQNPSDENVNKVVTELNSSAALLEPARNNPKSAFLVETILLAKEWLGGK